MAPQNQAAWITKEFGKPLEVADAPYSPPGENEVVFKSAAVAINPVDWKMQDLNIFIKEYPTIFGCDVAGVIEEVGSKVMTLKKGDRVIGQPPCLLSGKEYGAFQQYVKCPANVACKIPDWMTFEQSCGIPLAVNTAAFGFFQQDILGLPLPAPEHKPATDVAIFLYGGSTSVGLTGIQLAKAAGVFVVTTAGPKNIEQCKQLGADVVISYKDENWISQAADALTDRRVAGAYDCISQETTLKACRDVLAKAGSRGAIANVNMPIDGVDTKSVFGAMVTQHDELARTIWSDFLPQALEARAFIPKPDVQVVGHGLKAVQQAMESQKEGVSARKIVVTL